MSSYDPFEDRLRQALQAEAQTITPAGDGLSQIRAKVVRRRDRLRWLRPGLAVATAAALGGAAVFAAALTDDSDHALRQDRVPATSPSDAPTTPTPGPTASPSTPVPTGRTAYTVWPFTTLAQAQAWQRSGGGNTSYRDPARTALGFMGFIQAPEVDSVIKNEAETTSAGPGRKVTLGRRLADGSLRAVTVVHLVRLGTGSSAPYAVTRAAGAYTLKITTPGLAAPVRSPLAVKGTIDGVHQSVRVELRVAGGKAPISAPAASLGSATQGWQTSVSFTPPASGVAALVARTDSDAGDGAVQITAQPVLLIAGRTTGFTPVAQPAADGDIDGDGRTDAVTFTASGNGRATVTAELTRLGRQRVSLEVGATPFVPTVMGVVDADADGYAELFVKVDQQPFAGLASIVRLVNGRLAVVVMTAGVQDRFDYSGPGPTTDSFGCAELDPANPGRELFAWGGSSKDGITYSGTLTTYRFAGATLQILASTQRDVAPTAPVPTGCGSLRFP